MQLREPYQVDAVEATLNALTNDRRALLVLPTGTGKTVVFCHIIHEFMSRGRTLVLAHRKELIDQAVRHIKDYAGVRPDIEMADQRANEGMWKSPIVVSTIATQNAMRRNGDRRMERFDPKEFSLLVIDEAHHAPAATYRRIIDYYSTDNPNLMVLGVTATPKRTDEQALGQIFQTVAYQYELQQAVEDGWLVHPEVLPVNTKVDFSKVKTLAGEFHQKQLAEVLAKDTTVLHEFAHAIKEKAGGGSTLVFTASTDQAEDFVNVLDAYAPGDARIVLGTTDKDRRDHIINGFRDLTFNKLVSYGVCLEGFDAPKIQTVAVARPFKSTLAYMQAIGRGTRPWPGVVDGLATAAERKAAIEASPKPSLLVLDLVGISGRHKVASLVDILGGKYVDEVKDRAREKLRTTTAPLNVVEALINAQAEFEAELERKKRRKLAQVSSAVVQGWKRSIFDHQGQPVPHPRIARAVTPKMKARLRQLGVPEEDIVRLTPGKAGALIGKYKRHREHRLCTYKQAKVLKRAGYGADEYHAFTVDQASRIITELKEHGWKREAVTA